ncbi:hypothetical protein [Escherichia coli]|uniref:F4 family fimbrial subunit n=1 Tax=Escherichia coli TaxID=562 RepID=UPI0011115060|nr:hypothetical protein [Escherichia coli]
MKKTLIALAVAASAVVSGSAMAAGWEQNGSGGSVDLGGTLIPVTKVTPWEVATGDAVSGLNALIKKGDKKVEITVNQAIPVLGIRTQSSEAFQGGTGISPQISFGGAIDITKFNNGVTDLSAEVRDNTGTKIGSLVAPLSTAAAVSWTSPSGRQQNCVIASTAGEGFYGGVATDASGVAASPDALVSAVFPGAAAHYTEQNITDWSDPAVERFADTVAKYSAYYGSGIASGSTINITLEQPAAGDEAIQWNASLPVTVTYM